MTAKHKVTLKRVFGGLPVVDAKRELRIFADRADISNATKKDPTNCVFAKACQRLYGSHAVAFFRNVAYVELPDQHGRHRIERFMLTNPAKRSIVRFDKTGRIDPAGYDLIPPSKGQTLSSQLQRGRELRAMNPVRSTPTRAKAKTKVIAEVRDGKGLVKFLGGAKEKWSRTA